MFYSADSRRPAPGGFTLIELAAVVFLIGLILALGLPRLIPVDDPDERRKFAFGY